MPTYTLRNKKTKEIEEHFVSIARMKEMKNEGYEVVHLTPPSDLGHTDGMLSKTDDSWKDMLKTIKKHSGKGNTIKV